MRKLEEAARLVEETKDRKKGRQEWELKDRLKIG